MRKQFFRFFSPVAIAVALCSLTVGCKGNGSGYGNLPSDFQQRSDTQKIMYLVDNVEPDSVARFICAAAIDEVPGVSLDSLSVVTLYAYNHYKGKDLERFQNAFDEYPDKLPLAKKMKLLFKASLDDPIQLGYQLGLEYTSQIRDQHKSADEVESEIKEFRKACGKDTETYQRFLQGFKIALEADHGKDLPEDVYRRFINY
ncbi:MAG: hypothetical protein K2N03_07950 [Muribaculaceae bacterium]|nr:hypothetical protein [Muribaculaceae bacterium]